MKVPRPEYNLASCLLVNVHVSATDLGQSANSSSSTCIMCQFGSEFQLVVRAYMQILLYHVTKRHVTSDNTQPVALAYTPSIHTIRQIMLQSCHPCCPSVCSRAGVRLDRQVSGGSASGSHRLHRGGGGQQAQVHSHCRVRVQHPVAEATGAAHAGLQAPGPGNAVQ